MNTDGTFQRLMYENSSHVRVLCLLENVRIFFSFLIFLNCQVLFFKFHHICFTPHKLFVLIIIN